ncbi:MAG: ABC transporter substrate-binding protein [Gemmatimonadota bacterium]
MRVVSCLPAATEIVAALGAIDHLVGISHQCDYPPEVGTLPRVTSTTVASQQTSGLIDQEVRRLRNAGHPVIAVDGERLRQLAPDLILTQDLCQVCAVSDGTIRTLASLLSPAPAMVSLAARDMAGIREDIRTVGSALNRLGEAEDLISRQRLRLTTLGPPLKTPPRVVCIEWLEPLYLAGHWVPEIVSAAGGIDVGARPGQSSRRCTWQDVIALAPDIIVIMLCGFDLERSLQEVAGQIDAAGSRLPPAVPAWILDGNAYTSRAGPRVIDAVELLHQAFRGVESEQIRPLRHAGVSPPRPATTHDVAPALITIA